MRLAAIDIGSNAVRLLINDITTYKDGSFDYTKVNLVRVPLRLGFDVFEMGIISEKKTLEIIETMKAFKHLMNVYGVKANRACATSAMRDALNAPFIIEEVQKNTGINIEVISGSEEAQILYETHQAENMDVKNAYLYIDVGGGSTELTFYNKQNEAIKRSFNIGTIRLLKERIDDKSWDEMKSYVKTNIKSNLPIVAIGSGGNINKIFSLSKRKLGKPLQLDILKSYHKEMSSMSLSERMHKYGFREDRADVIVPALQIYISIMRWAGIDDIFVPQIGLADGIIRILHQSLNFTSMMGLKKV